MLRWLLGRDARNRAFDQALKALDARIWPPLLAQHDFLRGLDAQEVETLRQHTAWILANKAFHGAHGLPVTPDMCRSIAIQAALPILGLDTSLYRGWTQIVVYPAGFLVPCIEIDEAGIVHEYVQEASGESWEGGPVILSWEDASARGGEQANVVIHEFAHKLDQRAGGADGMPGLRAHRDLDVRRWNAVLNASFDDFNARLDRVEASIPPDMDPDSAAAAVWYATLPLDSYAAQDLAEFFAVSSESFFTSPQAMAQAWPDWYDLLARYYRQDPLRRLLRRRDPAFDQRSV
ncbi:M90 family metallopeptidase [Castellaniella sp.]|uniref:M90 family metallopeptidase n=1 Tax=Castellaniella sp. TaxID=1955812 RepID=UPI002AFF99F6|nr:M90 family metallopeptidase [Castellaniella sp.]